MQYVQRLLSRRRTTKVALGVLLVSTAMLVISLTTSRHNRTLLDNNVGGDWPAFYNAGRILNNFGPDQLYDQQLQSALYHQTLLDEPANVNLPYANSPLLAMFLRSLALLSYTNSYIAWIGISLILFTLAIRLAWLSADLPEKDWKFGLLLLLSFEPLIVECIHGGQISAIGLTAICGAIYLHLSDRPIPAGMMLAICTYKPTLLLIILPMLLVTRQWKVIGGFFAGSILLGSICLLGVGWRPCEDYLRTLLFYTNQSTASAGQTMFRTWKFIDLNAFLKLLGVSPMFITLILAVCAAVAIREVHRSHPTNSREHLQSLWACALTCTLILNLYVGIYDSVLILPSLLLTAGALIRRQGNLPSSFRLLAAALYLLPWCSQILARETGYQPFTIALILTAIYQYNLNAPPRESYLVTQHAAT